MTLLTTQPLGSIMLRMTKTNTKCSCRRGRASSRAQLMASAAGRNVAAVRLRTRRVTRKAVCVRIEARRYRLRDSAAQRSMTTGTRRVLVTPMIETHSKTRQPGEGLDRSRLRVCMTDRADLMARVCELLRMTTRARCVIRGPRHDRTWLVRFSSMAQKTRQSGVVRVVVLELRKICPRALRRNLDRANQDRERD